jgi:lysophospholipase L1-like esterase
MYMLALALVSIGLSNPSPRSEDKPPRPTLAGVRRVVFLGDSITYAGGYITYLEAFLRLDDPKLRCEFLDLGLPSETVSGLTEPGHAGGQFPRPDLRERLDRVLVQTKPDLIIACYGMNDGIYHPFSEARFGKYKDGIVHLRQQAAKAGARVLHLTPPVFDPLPIQARTLPAGLAEYRQPYEGYDDVLERYANWLLDRRNEGWDVVEIHGPMKRFLAAERRRDPAFRLADDGVHINAVGHWLIAREVLRHWGVQGGELGSSPGADQVFAARPHGTKVLELVGRRQALRKDAWLTATGHTRPGMARGLPLDRAGREADAIEDEIRKLLGHDR